uniref:Uncharacterized protein n=1 Tax=viral metagenome TaxID=1070528 RepID=A0A6C0M0I5_9ZZZZ
MKIKFEIDIEQYPEMDVYTKDEAIHVCKHLFIDWYRERYQQANLHDRICNVVQDSLIPTITEMQTNYKELFGISKVSQKKGEIMENNIFDIFKTHLQDYAITPTNQIPHHGDAEVVTPSNLKLLLEIKNYTNAVEQKEINKLKFDMKENNIKCGLFLSIKSGICGHKMIDYEIFDGNIIVYVSYVGDVYKVYCGLLILEALYNMSQTIVSNDNCIERKVKEGMEDMIEVLDMYTATKSKFQTMEKCIKNNLDEYYLYIREQEIKMKNKINLVFTNITNDIERIKKETLSKDKHLLVLQRTIDVFEENGIELISKNEYCWELKKGDTILGELKRRKIGIDVIWKNPDMEIRMANFESNYNTLKQIILLA